MKKLWILCLAILSVVALSACSSASSESGEGDTVKVKIGVNGSDGVQWPILKEKAAKEGIEIELIEFQDYTLPNNALAQGDLDINAFQHIAFLGQYVKESGEDLVPIGSTMLAPIGIYSEKITDVSEIKEGDKIAIPDDPSNQARSLRLLESAELITLADDFGMFGDPSKIAENPLNLEIIPMTAQQTPRVLPDVTASVINNGVAGQAGFSPGEDPIFIEDANGEATHPYVNIIAARAEDKDNETYKRIVELYQEKDIEQAIKEDTNGGSFLVKLTQEELDKAFEQLKK
ncbi:methionine ABC transporter substrate-binding protein [Virgibacillus profundi]|uniref:Lipoprotein n=1 Tax=Virgibacillus profundi TaxID=2024555 RepID=A0A2A2IIN6_9BACI|nr:MetQ/NlpA family ABC transporter substrate-binding protein [Virgibacillus profundi]PAV31659.1 methionine ABC transporter substrate-binding protein [Virgibacillus profundi]PXY55845.1 methionine ABC transporter substrate-binding protein [Virgibacillus profundi]